MVGVAGQLSDGRKAIWDANQPVEAKRIARMFEEAAQQQVLNGTQNYDDENCQIRVNPTQPLDGGLSRRITDCSNRLGPALVILGDSHATDIFGAAIKTDETAFILGFTAGACRAHRETSQCRYQDVADFIKNHTDHIGEVVYVQAGFYLMQKPNGHAVDRSYLATNLKEPFSNVTYDTVKIRKVRNFLQGLSTYIDVTWLLPRLEPHIPAAYVERVGCSDNFEFRSGQIEAYQELETWIANDLGGTTVKWLSQTSAADIQSPRDFITCSEIYWADGDHFSDAGERRFGTRMDLTSLLEANKE